MSTAEDNRRKAPRSSFSVFMSYISYENGSVNVKAIFSPACLKTWLQTRRNKIKFPQQSFQRTLYAHIRGVEQRQPFPAHIEVELLKHLRTSNAWKPILDSLGIKVVKRSFKKLGFHEGVAKTRKRYENSDAVAINSQLATISNSLNVRETPYDRFFRVLEGCLSQDHLRALLRAASVRGYELESAAMKYMVNLQSNPDDFRFNSSFFTLQQQESVSFEKGHPIGTIINAEDGTIEYMDEIAKTLYGGDCTNRHLFELHPCLGTVMFTYSHWIPDILKEGKLWTRNAFFNSNGELEVFLSFNAVLRPQRVGFKTFHQIQKVTHLYPQLSQKLSNPFLLS